MEWEGIIHIIYEYNTSLTVLLDWQKGYYNIRVDVNNDSKHILLEFSSSTGVFENRNEPYLLLRCLLPPPADIYFLGVHLL